MTRISRACVVVVGFTVLGAGSASASPLCTSLGGTLNNFLGQSCLVGDILFSFGSNAYSSSTGVSASNIAVAIVGNGLPNVATGFIFSPPATTWKASTPGDAATPYTADVNLAFNAAFSPLYVSTHSAFTSSALTLNETIVNGSNLVDSLTYIGVGENLTDQNNSGLPGINLNATGTNAAAYANSTGWVASQVNISKDAFMFAYAMDPSSAQINGITETVTFTQNPEPQAFVLTAAGLGLLFLLRRRKKAAGFLAVFSLMMVAAAGSARASPLCTSATLNTYDTSGFSCSFGDFSFSNFSYTLYTNKTAGFGNAYTASTDDKITVNPFMGGFQLAITNPADSTTGSAEVKFTFAFDVSSPYLVTSFYTNDTVTTANGTCAGPPLACITVNALLTTIVGNTTEASETYSYPSSQNGNNSGLTVPGGTLLHVSEVVDLVSSGSGAQTHLSNLQLGLTDYAPPGVPEPLTMVLTGSALIGLAAYLRHRRSRT